MGNAPAAVKAVCPQCRISFGSRGPAVGEPTPEHGWLDAGLKFRRCVAVGWPLAAKPAKR